MAKKASEQGTADFMAAHQQDIAAHPNSPEAFIDKGWSHLSRKEFDEAIAAFEAAASLDSRSVNAHYGLGAASKAKGDLARARQAFQKVIELSDKSGDPVKALMMGRMSRWALKELEQ